MCEPRPGKKEVARSVDAENNGRSGRMYVKLTAEKPSAESPVIEEYSDIVGRSCVHKAEGCELWATLAVPIGEGAEPT